MNPNIIINKMITFREFLTPFMKTIANIIRLERNTPSGRIRAVIKADIANNIALPMVSPFIIMVNARYQVIHANKAKKVVPK